jgi:hypothetical protein
MVVYRCWFNFKDAICVATSTEGLAGFNKGFWITEQLKLTKGGDCKYWIPPSQIILIEKGAMP